MWPLSSSVRPMNDPSPDYLLDLGFLLREDWQAAEQRYKLATGADREFEAGRRRAYRQVLTLMLHQAETFGLDPSEISLQGLDVDKDLGY